MQIDKLRNMTRHDDESPRVAELAALFMMRSATVEPVEASDAASCADGLARPRAEFELSPPLAARIAEKLVLAAERLQSFAIIDCNSGLSEAQEHNRDKAAELATEIGEALGFRVETGGDPRGCVVKLYDPTDERAGDGFGGGWGVYR